MLAALFLTFALAVDLGPAVGSTIPETESFEPMMGEAGATIVFVRSVDWCPYCKKQVMELSEAADRFDGEGRPLIFVSYDSADKQETFAKRREIQGAFIADEGSELIKAFGLLNKDHVPGSRAYGIPHPAVIVVDEGGVVKAKLYEEDYATNDKSYRNRPAVETIFEAAKAAE